jgi:polysaccharide transporter, PST family
MHRSDPREPKARPTARSDVGTVGKQPRPTPSMGQAAARGVGVTLIAQVMRAVIQFGSLVAMARLLDVRDFGVVASVTAIIGVADVLRDFGLSSAAIQSRTLNDDERTNLFWANTAFGTACAALIIAAAPLIDRLYDQRLFPITLSLAGLFIISGANTQFNAELARAMRFRVLAFSEVTAQAVGAVAGVALAVAGAGYWAIVIQQLVPVVGVLTLNATFCRWRPGLPKRHVSITRFFRFGINVLGTQLIAYATRNVDNVAVGVAKGSIELGYYSRAYQLLITPLNLINAPMTRVALPVLSRVQDDDATYARYLQRAQLVGCYVTATILAVACGLSGPIVAVLFGPGWHQVIPIFSILAIGGVFRAVEQISYWMFLSRGKTAAQLRLYVITRPVLVAVIISGAPWGGVGVATTSSIGYFVYWIASLIAAGRATNVDVRPLFAKATRAIVFVSAPCAVAAYVGSLVSDVAVLQLAAGLGLAAVYLAVVTAVVAPIRDDARLVMRFGRDAIRR